MGATHQPHRVRLAKSPKRDCAALFVDRDGTVIADPGYVSDPADVSLIPGAAGALRRFQSAGFALVVVTNQSGIGRGLYGWSDYDAVASRLRALLEEAGVALDAEIACGHSPEEGETCGWRKPAPGMILEAANRLDLDLACSRLAGDKLSDILAANAAGIPRAIHVASGHGASERDRIRAWSSPIAIEWVDDLSTASP